MSVKKTKKPTQSVRYLLSGDKKLQKLSLRKISAPAKETKPAAREKETKLRVKPAASEHGAMQFPWGIRGRVVVVGTVCLLAAAALLTARQPAEQLDREDGNVPREVSAPSEQPLLTAAPDTNTPVVRTASATVATPKPRTALPSVETVPPAAPKTVRTVKPVERPEVAASAAAPQPTAAVEAATATVEGCLERDDETYYLKNTSGASAPKARSWRLGFLVKRSPSIALVDGSGTLKLKDHVGQRVAATGTLVEREMHARALQRVAGSCR